MSESHLEWTKASKSMGSGACVELARMGNLIAMRDSKNPGSVLYFTRPEVAAFLDGVKNDEFDHLIGRESAKQWPSAKNGSQRCPVSRPTTGI